jgi:murein DD-endopeptidase MepM/ murein hydrolase activator NlpD
MVARKPQTIEVVVRDEVTRALERARSHMRQVGGGKETLGGITGAIKGLEGGIESVARGISREFGTLARMAGGSLLGAGFVAGLNRTAQALGNVARAATQQHYLAEQIGLTTQQLANLTARGRAFGLGVEQTTAGISSLSKNLRDLKMLGQNAPIYKSLTEAGGGSGQRFGDKLIAAVRGPGGYDAGVHTFIKLMSETNAQAQSKLSDMFNLGSIAFRDLDSLGLGDLPKPIVLSDSAARDLTRSTALADQSWTNIKNTVGGALMPAVEQLARTLDAFLQGPGAGMLKQFTDWVSKINIPWGAIGTALASAAGILSMAFIWVKKAIVEVTPIVDKIGGWGPLLLTAGAVIQYGNVNKVTLSLYVIGGALTVIGEHDWVLKALADASRLAMGTGKLSSQFGSPYSRNIEDRRGQPSIQMPPNAKAMRGGYNLMSSTTGSSDDDDDITNALSNQLQSTSAQVMQLANIVATQGLTPDQLGGGTAGGGQIRIPSAGGGGGGYTPRPRAAPPPSTPRTTTPPSTPPSTPPAPPPSTPPVTPPTPSSTPSRPSSTTPPGPTPGPTQPPPGGTNKGVLLFAHGLTGRYAGMHGSIAQVEADVKRYAAAHGYSSVEFIYGSPAEQERQMLDRVKRGGVGGLLGFSAGAGPARRVSNATGVPAVTTGAPRVPGDVSPAKRHMDQIRVLAEQEERKRLQQNPTAQPQVPTANPQQPTTGRSGLVSPVTGSFGENSSNPYGAARKGGRPHSGVDWRAENGTPAVAMIGGVVTHVGYDRGGYDNYAVVKGDDGVYRRYAYHGRSLVHKGQRVEQKQPLGIIDRRHLHYEEIHPKLANGKPNPVYAEFERNGNASTSYQRGTSDPSQTLNMPYRTRVTAGEPLGGQPATAQPAQTSPIVYSNEDEIERLKYKKELDEQYPQGGYTPIPKGRISGLVNLQINVRGPRGVKVSGEGAGVVGPASIDRSDPSGGIEGFSPA